MLERHAWWLYYAAYEPVSIVSLQLLYPLLLSTLTTNAATCTSNQCLLFGHSPSVFTFACMAVAVLVQTFAFISIGALADYGHWRRRVWWGCGWIGGSCALLTLLIGLLSRWIDGRDMVWLWLVSGLFVCLQMVFGCASICYNSVLPLLVNKECSVNSENISAANIDDDAHANGHNENRRQLKDHELVHDDSVEKIANEISLKGMMSGYGASLLELGMTAAILIPTTPNTNSNSHALAITIPIGITGAIWMTIGTWAIYKLKIAAQPGLIFPPNTNPIIHSWKCTIKTVCSLKGLPNLRRYLLSYLFFSDGYGTIGMVAVLFGREEMHMPEYLLVVAMVCLLICSVIGSFVFMHIQRFTSWNSVQMTAFLCALLSLIPLWGMAGLLSDSVGFRKPWEAFMVASYYGFMIGPINSFARVAFSEMIPTGREAEFFSLFAITDKGSSILGPAMFASVELISEQRRWGMIGLWLFLIIPLPALLFFVNLDKAKQEAKNK